MTLLLFLFLSPSLLVSEEVTFDEANKFYEQKNYKKAFSLLKELEKSKDPRVYHLLGELHYYGDHVDENDEKAAYFYGLAANLDFAPSITRLGVMHEEGFFFEVNVELANEFYFRAHELNDDEATYFLAVNIQFGAGIEQNIPRAISFYEEAVRRGNESAIIDLGYLYVNGEFIAPDYEKGFNLFQTLENDGVPDALHNLALMYTNGYYVDVNIDKAFEYYERAHLQGWAPSTFEIGNLYYYGDVDGEVDYKNAADYYQLAADLDYPPAIYSLGWMYQYGEAVEQNGEKAFELYMKAADLDDPPALNQLGLIFSEPENEQFDIVKGRMYYKKAYELGDFYAPLNLARTYNYYVNYTDYSEAVAVLPSSVKEDILLAREWYQKAIEIGNYDGIPEYAETFANLGNFKAATDILLKGIQNADAFNPPDTGTKVGLLSFLSGYYEVQGYFNESLRVMEMAVSELEQSLGLFDHYTQAMTYRDYASALNSVDDNDKALIYYEKSGDLLSAPEDGELLAYTLNGKGTVLKDLERYEDAIEAFEYALRLLEDSGANTQDDLGMIHANLVYPLLETAKFNEALIHSQNAVRMLGLTRKDHPWHVTVVSDLANVHERLGNKDAAIRTHSFSERLFSDRYLNLPSTEINLFRVSEYYRNLFYINRALEFFYNEYENTKETEFLDKAFLMYQKNRISTAEFEMARLSDRLLESSELQSGKLKDYQLYSDKKNFLEWELLQGSVIEKIDDDALTDLQSEIDDTDNKLTSLSTELKSSSKGYTSLFGDRFLTINDVQKNLSNNQLLVFPAETYADTPVTVFFISSTKVVTTSTSMEASELRDAGIQLRSSLQFNGSTSLNDLPEFDLELSYNIYNELFSDIMDQFTDITDLIVVPSWPISNLPLAVLVSDDPSKTNLVYEDQAWLGLEKNISYIPSVSDLRMAKENRSETLLSSFAGFGNPVLGLETNNLRGIEFVELQDNNLSKLYNFDKLPSLPSTEKEVLAVASVFPDDSSYVFLKTDANEENLRNTDLSKINVLLFATHGIIAGEWEFLDEPALVLTPAQIDSNNDVDGLLTASEIRELSLNADFVVLSACNTAAGDESGEGLSGLASAFIFAGAKSIMASHWSVESDSTQILITNFFQNLKKLNGTTGPEALRKSMQQLFETPNYSHPIFWAPFILVGQT